MAKTSMKVKQQRKAKFSTREYSRCRICGRPHAYLRKYGICRICFRELAYKGQIPGVKKASWQAGESKRVPIPNQHVGRKTDRVSKDCSQAFEAMTDLLRLQV